MAPSAHAAFSSSFVDPCSGENTIDGRGATFANTAQGAWISDFTANECDTVGVTYNNGSVLPANQGQGESGSGAGRRAFGQTGGWNTTGVRHSNIRFIGVDEPPTPSQETDMENGPTPDVPTDDGVLRIVPITSGAVTIAVNFPDGCTIPSDLQYRPAADGTVRLATDNLLWEAAFSREITTWGDLVPGIGGAGCAAKPITRVVRSDSSGTTFAFKSWLNSQNDATGWNALYTDPNNIVWPDNTNKLTGNGNGGVASTVAANDGAIGYVELSAARAAGFTHTGTGDTTWWVPVQNSLGAFQDPQSFVDGYRNNDASRKGANCARATYTGIPGGADPTTGNWFNVSGVNSPAGYGICALTYAGIWDDYCDVYGSSDFEQARARSVYDYEKYILTGTAQNNAKLADYSPLPPSVLSISQGALSTEPWRKAGGSCS